MLNWAVGREYLEKTPFRRGTETLIKKLREDNQRRRRLLPDEELRLLAAAPPHLRSMIITALDTGTRRGEMLALRFADIDFARGLIVLRGETTKSKKTRLVPISTQRLRAVPRLLAPERGPGAGDLYRAVRRKGGKVLKNSPRKGGMVLKNLTPEGGKVLKKSSGKGP